MARSESTRVAESKGSRSKRTPAAKSKKDKQIIEKLGTVQQVRASLRKDSSVPYERRQVPFTV